MWPKQKASLGKCFAISTAERWSLSLQPPGAAGLAPQILKKWGWQMRSLERSLRNHGELKGPQTHRLWVAAVADLLKTLCGGLHPAHSLSLLSARSWLIPQDGGVDASPHPQPGYRAALQPSFSPSLPCRTQAVGLTTSVTKRASKLSCQASFQQK